MVEVRSVSYRLAILTMRWDKSFAYDLVDYHGPVSCRQALLFGSAEGKPDPVARFSPQVFIYEMISRGFFFCHIFCQYPNKYYVSIELMIFLIVS